MINLGDKNWGVKDSGLLAYKQVGSRFFNKDFDFTRASSGTYIDKNGVLQTAEVYNLLDYSQDFSQSYWVKIPNLIVDYNVGVTANGDIISRATSTDHNEGLEARNITVTQNTSYTFSFWGKIVEGSQTPEIRIRNASASVDIIKQDWADVSTTEFKRQTITFTTPSGCTNIYVSISLYSGAAVDYYFYGAQLVEGTEPSDYQYTNGRVGIPRVDFSDGVGALLLEPQRSNLLLQSNSFDTTWATTNSSVTSGQDGIYGSNNAWVINKTGTFGRIAQSSSVGLNTFSIYAKANTLSWIRLFRGSGEQAYFDLLNGVVGSTSGSGFISADIENVGNGWFRCSITYNSASLNDIIIYPAESNGNASGTSGSIYIQHAQLESGSYPTSIIETTTSQVTRIADVANNCGTEQDFNSEEGTIYAEMSTLANDGTFRVMSINDGTTGNVVQMYFSGVDNRITAETKISNVSQGYINYTLNNALLNNKIAFKYKENDFALWVNGIEVGTDTSGSVLSPNTLNNFDFALVGSLPFYGKVRSVKYFPTALTDDELQNLTS